MKNPKTLSAGDGFGANTWNNLVRFVRSLRLIQGPGIKLERTPNGTVVSVERVKVQRVSHSSPIEWPWTFVCRVEVDPTTHEETRTGGWRNCRVQFGLEFRRVTTGINDCADGDYYLKVRTLTGAMELVCVAPDGTAPASDPANDTYFIWIGKVENAVQTDGIYWVPVIYINL